MVLLDSGTRGTIQVIVSLAQSRWWHVALTSIACDCVYIDIRGRSGISGLRLYALLRWTSDPTGSQRGAYEWLHDVV